jgi:hypothetical protein
VNVRLRKGELMARGIPLPVDKKQVRSRLVVRNAKLFDLAKSAFVAEYDTNRPWGIKECNNVPGNYEITLPTTSGSSKPTCERRVSKGIDWL